MAIKVENNNILISKIKEELKKQDGIKARDLARRCLIDRSELNAYLHKNREIFNQDETDFTWRLVDEREVKIEFPPNWLSASLFESVLNGYDSALDSKAKLITFKVHSETKVMVDAAARLLSLCNQLIFFGKNVQIEFSDINEAFSYLNRAGFFEILNPKVQITPKLPDKFFAQRSRGNSVNLKEFGVLDLAERNGHLVEELRDSFIHHAYKEESDEVKNGGFAFTVISELLNNVYDHSQSEIPGFAALQRYNGNRKHIQIVISDSGIGIFRTLRKVLGRDYPELDKKFSPESIQTNAELVKYVIENGLVSSVNRNGGGAGLNRTQQIARKYNAKLIVRQENFQIEFSYKNGELDRSYTNDRLRKILGTHICFDYFLD